MSNKKKNKKVVADKQNTSEGEVTENLNTEEVVVEPEDRDVESMVSDSDWACKKLKEENEKLKQENAATQDKYLRSLADFEIYQKRVVKERSDLLKYQGEKILLDMVDVLDDLERALEHSEADPAHLKSGVELIHKNFLNVLDKWGVKGESALGKVFDPVKQNALGKVPTEDVEAGVVVNELKKAYFYKDRLLRAGEVIVAEEKPQPSLEDAELPKGEVSDEEE